MDWREQAACAGLPWEYQAWFFGEGETLPVHEQHERARMVCYLCPVQMDCLEYWHDTDGEFGVWGGLTVSQRKRYLTPILRKAADRRSAMSEVIWTLGVRLLPKIEQAFADVDEEMPELPVDGFVPTRVLVRILGAGQQQAA